MYVIHGKATRIRVMKECEIAINGSFMDIHFEDDGVKRFIGIPMGDIYKLLENVTLGSSVNGFINYDMAGDANTAIADFLSRSVVKDAL